MTRIHLEVGVASDTLSYCSDVAVWIRRRKIMGDTPKPPGGRLRGNVYRCIL